MPFGKIRPVRRWSNEITFLLARFVRCDAGRTKLHFFEPANSMVKPSKQFEVAFVDVFRSSTQNEYETNGWQVARRLRCEFGAMPTMIRKPSMCLPATNPRPEVHKSFLILQLDELECSDAFAQGGQARGG